MAVRTYGPQTLNDNWFEDHATPLNGVVADYGNREYGTTFKDDFKRSDLLESRSGWQAKLVHSHKMLESGATLKPRLNTIVKR